MSNHSDISDATGHRRFCAWWRNIEWVMDCRIRVMQASRTNVCACLRCDRLNIFLLLHFQIVPVTLANPVVLGHSNFQGRGSTFPSPFTCSGPKMLWSVPFPLPPFLLKLGKSYVKKARTYLFRSIWKEKCNPLSSNLLGFNKGIWSDCSNWCGFSSTGQEVNREPERGSISELVSSRAL